MSAECFNSIESISKNKKSKNKKRFNDEQIRSLEAMFEYETKLDTRKKLQLARELGLQPRQIAIWFQNRRARWKSKQLERDCRVLRANYHNLASQFEALKKEKDALFLQLQKLNNLMEMSRKEFGGNSAGRDSDNGGNTKRESDVWPRPSPEGTEKLRIGMLSDYESCKRAEYVGLDEEFDALSMFEPADSSLTSPENWDNLGTNHQDQQISTTGDYQLWDFWH